MEQFPGGGSESEEITAGGKSNRGWGGRVSTSGAGEMLEAGEAAAHCLKPVEQV